VSLQAKILVRRGTFRLDVDLHVLPGQVVAVLGPNGAGKSTLLSVLAGLLPISDGRVSLAGHILDEHATQLFRRPEHRRVGVVFQDYRLFANLSVLDNVAFGSRSRGVPRAQSRVAAGRWIEAMGLVDLAHRRPGALSGGQAQRVAVARALASEPDLLLLDEPLAALDVQSRAVVQTALREQLRAFFGPVLMVTHDPGDAMLLADRIVVLESGRIRQDATPAEVASQPATTYVANLLGLNLYRGRVTGGYLELSGGRLAVTGLADAPQALAVLRPAAITIHRHHPYELSARNVWVGRIAGISTLADRIRVHVVGRPDAIVDVTADAALELQLEVGADVWLSAKATDVHSYQPQV
jgi:molybdate transport system ATP-binding protein